MAVTRERFNEGLTYDEFKAQMTQNQEQFERNEQGLKLSQTDLAPFTSLATPLDVLVIAEDWCGDVVANLPILGRVARESGKLNLRVFLRDQNKDITGQFMNGSFESIPVFAFYGLDWDLRGVWIERPKSVTALRDEKIKAIHEGNPEFGPYGGSATTLPDDARNRLQQALREMRAETSLFHAAETVRELQELVTEVGGGPQGSPPWRGNILMASTPG
jgi:hypothetical protein